MVTIKDVAREANVSITTVSRILNQDENLSVTEDTRQRVLRAVERLQYKPQRKRRRKSRIRKRISARICVVLAVSQQEEWNDPYFLTIREGIEREALASGIQIAHTIWLNGSAYEGDDTALDGCIVVGNVDVSDGSLSLSRKDNLVFVDRMPQQGVFDSVVSNLEKATRQVLHHLFHLGHEAIGFIGGREMAKKINARDPVESKETRFTTFEAVMKQKGFWNPEWVQQGGWSAADGYAGMKRLIKDNNLPTAMVMGSDPLAIGALRAINEAGIRVPDQLALVSFDDIEAAAYLHPPLTTVRIVTEQMGRMAVRMLVDRMEGRTFPVQTVLPTKLIIRESCGGNPHQAMDYLF